ncbi:MAG: hypothetical protein Q7S72_01305 [Candidatus Taylorbacteria bacterium]|nr:hypothetical protein [Candidatus Taylorbacteria bacterium]
MYFRSLTISILLVSVFFGYIFALKTSAASPSDILLTMLPENPAPNENVSISLNSYAVNLDTVLISWFANGKKITEGVGKKTFSMQSGDITSETNVSIDINLPDGRLTVRTIIRPSNMVLLWQAEDSYVPPFYKGKALPTPDSSIRVVAMPEIMSGKSMISPNSMTYDWKLDYSNDKEASGYGKSFLIYNNDYLERSNNIGVVATTTDQKFSAANNINIETTSPKIVFYKKDQLLGTLWETAIGDNHRIDGDEILEASPYFISPKNPLNPLLVWNWSINGSQVALGSIMKNLIPLKKADGSSGVAKLKLQIENEYKIFQTTEKEINIEF